MNDLIKIDRFYFESGYWRGMRQPALLVTVDVMRFDAPAGVLRRFDELGASLLPAQPSRDDWAGVDPALARHPVLSRVVRFTLGVLAQAGMPVMGGVGALPPSPQRPDRWMLGLPALGEEVRVPRSAFSLACTLVNGLAQGRSVDRSALDRDLGQLLASAKRVAPAGLNSLRFLQAAHTLNVPWRHVANNVYQLGWGRRARWLDSSFTDETPSISTSLARDKLACAKVLRDAGLPVPRQQLVYSAEQARQAAQSMGYPVVVKPSNLDGGKGVFAGLKTPEAVERAYEEAAKLSQRILVEQFIEGSDYRLQVYKNEVFWVVHRRPAAVQGDGVATVVELVSRLNAQRAAQKAPSSADPMAEMGYAAITLDDEAQEWLLSQGLHADAVPAVGQVVRLRGAANVTMGGTREGVPLAHVHPDNQALAVQAAQALRLDLAGIDLLVPDIARSWKATGAGICEVNAQPQLSGHLQLQLLPKLLQGQGRIPVIGVCVPEAQWNDRARVQQVLADAGIHAVWVDSGRACWQALARSAVDAVFWQMNEPRQHALARPVDQLDVLVLPRDGAGDVPAADTFEQQLPRLWQAARQVWTVSEGDPAAPADVSLDGLAQALSQYVLATHKG
ncbi:MAG: acetate--CoA ligase family protein [Limnohabitans sp.]